MTLYLRISFLLAFISAAIVSAAQNKAAIIDLSGQWRFATDALDKGISEKWFRQQLQDHIILPGSMTTNDKGNAIDINTPWTGQIVDSSWFTAPEYKAYRQPGNIKIPFWLQPVKYYKGPAWYQKTITIPVNWAQKEVQLFIERTHWETTVWIDDTEVGMQNSMGTPHIYSLSKILKPGVHQITVRVDNRIRELNVGINSHSITDHTQSNWNGMIGRLALIAKPALFIDDVQVFPNLQRKEVLVKVTTVNRDAGLLNATVEVSAAAKGAASLKPLLKKVAVGTDTTVTTIAYSMGQNPLLWDEFTPHLYTMKVALRTSAVVDEKSISFGMREFKTRGRQFTINDRPVFLRGTLECAIFPKTGYPSTDVKEWLRILQQARRFGLNHIRFHSWCPPEAAFEAADQLGFYLQVEVSSWANSGAAVGEGRPLDEWLYEESNRMARSYGNHPSFMMLTYGNEPAHTPHYKEYLIDFVKYWQQKDARRLYTTGAGWPLVEESDYNSDPAPRIQGWGQGLKSIINGQAPRSDYDFETIIYAWQHPTVSHEIGQWCVYPDMKEIKKYTGVLKAKNFEIFRDRLQQNGLLHLADSFLLASGKLQTLCYKADIEAALRTKDFGGFQLLDLHDFPGQGTALVGVLNPFWEEKGYITGAEYSRFCNAVTPLARFPKMIYKNDETLDVPVDLAQYGSSVLKTITPRWNIKTDDGKTVFEGMFTTADLPQGSVYRIGAIRQSLQAVQKPSRLVLTVTAGRYSNSWDIFVYPAVLPAAPAGILITQKLDATAIAALESGGKVLLTPQKGSLKKEAGGDIAVGFSSIFWNTAWTAGQPPHTLGILCNPHHPALKEFPTQYHSNWQWWDAMSHSNAIRLDSIDKKLQPVVRVIDDWVTARPLALITEVKIGKGKLLLSGIDFLTDMDSRPEARQLLHSLLMYMNDNRFNPAISVDAGKIRGLFQ